MFAIESPQKALEYFEAKLEFTTEPGDLYDMIQNNEVKVIDVRAEKDYREGHIPAAVNLPKERWATCEGLTHDRPNVVYCYSMLCYLALKACIEFTKAGYRVVELTGGFKGWQRSHLPIEK
jgi:rhodanese-related sulfurtransferase